MGIKACLLTMGISEKRREAFLTYHLEHPQVWQFFEKYTLLCISKDKKFGANAIRERIRWAVEIEHGSEFKFNNNFTPIYARLFASKYPQHAEYFEQRQLKFVTKTVPYENIERHLEKKAV